MAAGDRKVLVTQAYVDTENDLQDNIILCCVTCLNTEFQTIKNVEKDWNEVNPLSPKFIKNKPLLRHSIADQSDTNISNLSNSDVLVWNSISSKWENKALVIEPVTDIEQAGLIDKVTPDIQNVNVLQDYTNTFDFKQTDTITISTVTGTDFNSSIFAVKILKDAVENAYYITFKTLDTGVGNIRALKLYSNNDKLTLAYWVAQDKATGDVTYTDQTSLDAKAYYLKYKDTASVALNNFGLSMTIPVTIDATITTPALKVNNIEIDVNDSNLVHNVLMYDGTKYKPTDLGCYYVKNECMSTKQDVLVSGTSIKTLNNVSLIGSGNINIDLASKQDSLVSGTNIKTVNGTSLLGSGDIVIEGGSSDSAICIITENSKTGYGTYYRAANPGNYGDIGINAVDLSYSGSASTANGATGNCSTAMGYGTRATGSYSTSIGSCTCATNTNSTAMGDGTIACGVTSTAMGHRTCAVGNYSTSIGYYTKACGYGSVAMGGYACTIGAYSTAMGSCTKACGHYSTAIGNNTVTYVDSSLVLGECTQIGSSSTKMFAVGFGTDAQATATGDYNVHFSVDCGGLTCTKQIKIVDGTQGLGKVLTSDANGLASWVISSSSGASYTAGNGIDLTGDVIAVTAACDTKWSTDTIVDISGKQDSLVSGTNIKTVNGVSLLGSGDIVIAGGSGSGNTARTYQSFISTNNQTTFNFDFSSNLVDVYLNGIHLSTSDYTLGTNQVILNEALVAGELIDLVGYTISVSASASETSINPVGNLTSTNTQLALVELQTDIDGINTQLTGLAAALANINS